MTRDEIIRKLFLGDNFNRCIQKMEPEHLRDDLRSEVILIVCELPEEKILGLHSRKELEFFTVRIILNLIKSDTSPFAKTYRQMFYPIVPPGTSAGMDNGSSEYSEAAKKIFESRQLHSHQDHGILQDRELKEQIEDIALAEIDKLYWYDKEMILMYKRLGNFRAIEDETGIPFISCYKNIKKSLQVLKDKAIGSNKTIFSKSEINQIKTK